MDFQQNDFLGSELPLNPHVFGFAYSKEDLTFYAYFHAKVALFNCDFH